MERSKVFTTVMVAALIFLSVTLLAAIVAESGLPANDRWSVSLYSPSGTFNSYAPRFVDDNDNLYVASGKTIYCLAPDGIRWSMTPPDPEGIGTYYDSWNLASAASGSDRSYLLIYPGSADLPGFHPELVAVTDNGRPLWTRTLESSLHASVATGADNVYLHDNNNEIVTESNGNVLWRLEDVYFLPAIDEGGSLYVFRDDVTGLPVEAYSPDGMLRWSLNMSERIGGGQGDQPQWNPIYSNGTLYVWLKCGVIALNPNGTVKWTKDFGGQGWHVAGGYRPDESGYLYISNSYGESYVLIIGPDGSEIKVPDNGAHLSSADRIVDGIAYVTTNNAHEGVPSSDDSRLEPPGIYDTMSGKQYFNLDMPSIDDFEQETVTAYDVRSGQQLWSFSLPSNRTCSVILNQSNVRYLMPGFADFATEVNKLPPDTWYNNAGLPTGSIKIKGTSSMTLYPGKDVRYVDYWAYNYEYPPFFGKSNCTSTGGLFALDRTGRLLWSTPTDSYITGVSEKNGTVYFATGDGRFSAASAGIGAGALAAAAYLFLRFFAMGTVTRARARLQKNGNRNGILGLIVAQPGPTLHEISRGTGLNVGTVRYHLFILATNHKIITYTDGTKFIRYFPGSGRYTDDEKLIIGLIRREPVKKMLMAMNEKQWQTNVEIADQSDLQESAVSKLLRELYGLGVIRKTVAVGEKTTYSLVEKFKPIVRDELGNANASPHYSPDISDGKITVN